MFCVDRVLHESGAGIWTELRDHSLSGARFGGTMELEQTGAPNVNAHIKVTEARKDAAIAAAPRELHNLSRLTDEELDLA